MCSNKQRVSFCFVAFQSTHHPIIPSSSHCVALVCVCMEADRIMLILFLLCLTRILEIFLLRAVRTFELPMARTSRRTDALPLIKLQRIYLQHPAIKFCLDPLSM
jgi:hypothetical protein